jgi:CubicO group peptidase (beta-lactamase class C family)
LKSRLTRRRFIGQSGVALLASGTTHAMQATARQKAKSSNGILSDHFLQQLPEMMELANVPGLAVSIIRDGKTVWTRGFGVKEINSHSPVDKDTLFAAGSLSKPVFAYAVLRLQEKGLIDLNRPLVNYLSATDLPDDPRTKQITARHALSHSTGWQNWRFRAREPLQFAFNPGERFSYSGEGIYLLQRAVEQITGQGFEAVMQEWVLKPLKMMSSSYLRLPEHETRIAKSHNRRGEPAEFGNPQQRQRLWDLAKQWNKPMATWRYEDASRAFAQATPELPALPTMLTPNAAGTLLTTTDDYARFVIRLMEKSPARATGLSETSRLAMLTPQQRLNRAISWGLGIGLQIEQGHTCFWHWGDGVNYKTFAIGDLAQRSGVVVLTNAANGHRLWERIVRQASGRDHAAFLLWMI